MNINEAVKESEQLQPTLREMLVQELIRINELKFEMGQFTNLNYDTYEGRVLSVIEMIDEIKSAEGNSIIEFRF